MRAPPIIPPASLTSRSAASSALTKLAFLNRLSEVVSGGSVAPTYCQRSPVTPASM